MLHEVFENPSVPDRNLNGRGFRVQIHSELPEQVKIGHYEMNRMEPIIDEVVSRAEYLNRIQQGCARYGEAYTVRFYDHLDGFDASVLDQLDQIRSLTIDPYSPAHNPEAIGRLPHLTRLGFAPRGKNRADILSLFRVERLTFFSLFESATPPTDLTPLGDAKRLKTLRLLARGRNVEAIGNCAALTELSMHPSDKDSLEFISRLPKLEVLKFSLGKLTSLASLKSAPALRDLSFNLVSMLEDLGDLQRFPTLRRLQTEAQKRLKILRVGRGNVALEHIHVEAIDEIVGLYELPALKSLSNFNGKMKIDWSKLPTTLTHFDQWPPPLKAREKHKEEIRARGLIPERHPDAPFFYK